MRPFELIEPGSLEEALSRLAERPDETRPIAGGTALVVLMKQGLARPERVISLGRLAELQAVGGAGGRGLRIGAAVRLHDLERSPQVRADYPLLAEALHKVGNIRVRQVATLGGNLSHGDYMSDPPTALAALDARVAVAGPGGRREVSVLDFIRGPYETALAPGELLVAVHVPPAPVGARGAYLKFAVPNETERPTASAAALLRFQGDAVVEARLILGAVAGRPVRRTEAEAELTGGPLTPAAVERAAEAALEGIEPLDDGRSAVWYKREVARVLVRRTLERLAAGEEARS